MSARYWVAKYISDVFRDEPRNVGVFVQIGDVISARFLGETDPGIVDRRKLKSVSYPDVYHQWVTYWRKQISKLSIESVVGANTTSYRVVEGGTVTETGDDSPEQITSYLYALLVEGGFSEAVAQEEETETERPVDLEIEIVTELKTLRILADGDDLFLPRHPIRRNIIIPGQHYNAHKPALVQENGICYVMEVIDLTSSKKKNSRDRAGWVASMFRDIKLAKDTAQTIGLVRVTEQDRENEYVKNGLSLLSAEASIVNWLETLERQEFLRQRQIIAEAF